MVNQNLVTFIPANSLGYPAYTNYINYDSFVTILNPLSIIHSDRINDIPDAEITLTDEQYKKSNCKIFDYFRIELVDQIFLITSISTEQTDNGFINYTIRGSELFSYVLSNHSAVIDVVADTSQLQANFLQVQINNFTPEIASSDDTQFVLIHFNITDNVGSVVNCIWNEGSTLLEYIQKEVEANQDLCFSFTSKIRGVNDTFKEYFNCILTISKAKEETLNENINWELNINNLTENYYNITDYNIFGQGGQRVLENGVIKNNIGAINDVPVTKFYTSSISKSCYLPAVKNEKANLSLSAISYENLYNILCQFTKPYYDKQQSLYTKKETLTGAYEGTSVQFKFTRQLVMACPGESKSITVNGTTATHWGIRLFYISEDVKKYLMYYYNSLLGQSANPYIIQDEGYQLTSKTDPRFGTEGLAYGSLFITRKLNLNSSSPLSDPENYFITLHDSSMTNNGLTSIDTTDNSILEAYDVEKNINYFSMPIWSIYEYLLIKQKTGIIKLSATLEDSLNERSNGSIIKINNINGEDAKGKINGTTISKESGETTRDYEIEWLQNE